ncbi:toxin-antitoxin system HicB family antitoxin [Embleya sp. AB8]|uniref:toxin-antitoxin system HicB family antitoxin n=1 Tax=Embleya sp. AB8 TaxID=3156304 RepID=UPI003C71F57C
MAKTQLNVRVDEEIAEKAKARAAESGQSIQEYVAEAIERDLGGPRTRFFEAADDFMTRFRRDFDRDFPPTGGGSL